MKKVSLFLCLMALLLLAVASHTGSQAATPEVKTGLQVRTSKLCSLSRPGYAHCLAIRANPIGLHPHLAGALPFGLGPADLQAAYNLPSSTAGRNQTIAIVDAYDDPTAEADLAVYRSTYNLPSCTTANGCFKKVDQNGTKRYPQADADWAGEISLDLDMASAICPNCRILLVEAKDSSFDNLGHAVDTAARLHASAISNSYGGSESWYDTLLNAHHYNHPGVVITASSGDNGYGVELPAAFNTVIAVGGTSLQQDTTQARGWTENAWSGAGSGCSSYVSKPKWQNDRGCRRRTVADVAAVADPNTGVAVYDSYGNGGGWGIYGGTSASSPIIASIYALAGNAAHINPAAYTYAHRYSLNNITSGNNGSCQISYLCNAQPGYNGPTGLGTPNGLGAF